MKSNWVHEKRRRWKSGPVSQRLVASSAASDVRGSVLLEVVLAIVLFAAAAAVVGMGLKASIDGAQRLRLSTHAGNLAVTVISELQMGLRSLADTGPEAFGPPFEGWVWEVTALPWDQGQAESALATSAATLMRVEVAVRYEPEGFVHRLAQVIDVAAARAGDSTLPGNTPEVLAP